MAIFIINFEDAGKKVIIEECLFGQEVSFTVLSDGKNFLSLLPSQDHKRVNDSDTGPNTGGMGAYAPVPFVDKNLSLKIEREIVSPTLKALKNNNETKDLKIAIFTAGGNQKDIENLDAFALHKDVTPETIVNDIKKLLT